MLSTPVWDAPQLPITSTEKPSVISLHESHVIHGAAVGPSEQLSDFARIRATVVFPTPRTPEKRYACAIRLALMAFSIVVDTCSWPVSSWKDLGRHFLART